MLTKYEHGTIRSFYPRVTYGYVYPKKIGEKIYRIDEFLTDNLGDL